MRSRGCCAQAAAQGVQLPLRLVQMVAQAALQMTAAAGRALADLLQAPTRSHGLKAQPRRVQPLLAQLRQALVLAQHALVQLSDPPHQFGLVRGQRLGRGGWRGGAQVGGQFRQRDIHFMANGGHHRHRRGRDLARQLFVVERPQILQRTATAGEQDGIVVAAGDGLTQALAQHRHGFGALHRRGQNIHRQQRETAPDHGQDIAYRGAGWRGDQRQPADEGRKRTLAPGVQQALGGELALELFKSPLQRAFAGFLHMADDQLVVAARLVQPDPALHAHQLAIGRVEGQGSAAGAEHGAAHLGAGVLEREVQVAGRGFGQVGDFSFQPHRRHGIVEQLPHQPVQAGRGQDPLRIRCQAHAGRPAGRPVDAAAG